MKRTGVVQPDELLKMMSSNNPPVVVDVRAPHEYKSDHISGSINIPEASAVDQLSERDPAETLVLVSDTGKGARRVAHRASQIGFEPLVLEGGLLLWQGFDYPVQQTLTHRLESNQQYFVCASGILTSLAMLFSVKSILLTCSLAFTAKQILRKPDTQASSQSGKSLSSARRPPRP